MAEGFNKDLDKVTEREVVYDFIERLTFGKTSNVEYANLDASKLIEGKETKLIDLIKVYNYLLPNDLQYVLANSGVAIDKSCVVKYNLNTYKTIELSGQYRLMYAYSDKLRFDITKNFDVDYNASTKVTSIQAGFKSYTKTADSATNASAGFAILFLAKVS